SLGVRELVVYDSDETPGQRIRAWDRIDGDLVERVVMNEVTPCVVLGELKGEAIDFVLAPGDDVVLGLRLTSDAGLLPTALEAERTAHEAERAAKEDALAEVVRLRAE